MEYTFQRFTPEQYLKIDIANNFGMDKENWDKRIAWFDENEGNLMDLVEQAEDPALFYAGVTAYNKHKLKKSIGYPVSLDATCSGMQWLAIMTGDKRAAELCNVIGNQRNDAYTFIYHRMVESLGEEAPIKREDTKRAIMTSLYASERVPKDVFGEGELYETFIRMMETYAPAAWELNRAMVEIWNPSVDSYHWVMPDNFHVHQKVYNTENHTVHFKNAPYSVPIKTQGPTEKGRSLGANMTHSVDSFVVREITRRCMYDPKKIQEVKNALTAGGAPSTELSKSGKLLLRLFELAEDCGYLSSRVLDVITKNNVYLLNEKQRGMVWDIINSLPAKPFELFVIHDAYKCHPNYGNDVRWQYIHQMVLISKSNMLSFLLSQILNREVNVTKYCEDLHLKIAHTEYPIC